MVFKPEFLNNEVPGPSGTHGILAVVGGVAAIVTAIVVIIAVVMFIVMFTQRLECCSFLGSIS